MVRSARIVGEIAATLCAVVDLIHWWCVGSIDAAGAASLVEGHILN